LTRLSGPETLSVATSNSADEASTGKRGGGLRRIRRRRAIDALDDDRGRRDLPRLQLEAKLPIDRLKDRRALTACGGDESRQAEAQVDVERARQRGHVSDGTRRRRAQRGPQRVRECAQRDAAAGHHPHWERSCSARHRRWLDLLLTAVEAPVDCRSFGSVPRTSAYPSMSDTS
jgi:hypothetical protein